jgi:hypothetical protein
VLGTATTDFFCGLMTHGSRLLWRVVDNPYPTLVAFLAALTLLVFGLSRATWRPSSPLRFGRRRAWGQVITSAARMYVTRWRLFLGIGLVFLPISIAITVLQAGVLGATSILGIEDEGQAAGAFALVIVAIGTALTLLGVGLVQAATARALLEVDHDREIGPLRAYRMAFRHIGVLVGVIASATIVVTVLTTSFVLWPIAIWLVVRWSLIAPVVAVEELGVRAAIRRSSELVRGEWLKVGSLTVVGAAVVIIAGPLIGTGLILLTSLPLALLNLVAGVVYMLVMPFVGLTTAYVYADTRVADRERPPRAADRLPAEMELS